MSISDDFNMVDKNIADLERSLKDLSESIAEDVSMDEAKLKHRRERLSRIKAILSGFGYAPQLSKGSKHLSKCLKELRRVESLRKKDEATKKRELFRRSINETKSMFSNAIWSFGDILSGSFDGLEDGARIAVLNNGALVEKIYTSRLDVEFDRVGVDQNGVVGGWFSKGFIGLFTKFTEGLSVLSGRKYYGKYYGSDKVVELSSEAKVVFIEGGLACDFGVVVFE